MSLTGFLFFFMFGWWSLVVISKPLCRMKGGVLMNKVSWLLQWEKSLRGFWILLYVLVGVGSECWQAGWEATSQGQVWAKGQGDAEFQCLHAYYNGNVYSGHYLGSCYGLHGLHVSVFDFFDMTRPFWIGWLLASMAAATMFACWFCFRPGNPRGLKRQRQIH